MILEALGVTGVSLNHLSPHLRLPVAVTCYWLQKAQPPPDQTLLEPLLLGLSLGDTLRYKAGNNQNLGHDFQYVSWYLAVNYKDTSPITLCNFAPIMRELNILQH